MATDLREAHRAEQFSLREQVTKALTLHMNEDPTAYPDELALAALKVVAPLLAERDAEIQRLRDELAETARHMDRDRQQVIRATADRNAARAELTAVTVERNSYRDRLVWLRLELDKALAALGEPKTAEQPPLVTDHAYIDSYRSVPSGMCNRCQRPFTDHAPQDQEPTR